MTVFKFSSVTAVFKHTHRHDEIQAQHSHDTRYHSHGSIESRPQSWQYLKTHLQTYRLTDILTGGQDNRRQRAMLNSCTGHGIYQNKQDMSPQGLPSQQHARYAEIVESELERFGRKRGEDSAGAIHAVIEDESNTAKVR
jgi:hypothetical protein